MARECCCCAVIFAFIFPPLAVLMMEGCGVDLCLNILLTLLGFIPGIIHAFLVIARPDPIRQPIYIHQVPAQYQHGSAPVVVNIA